MNGRFEHLGFYLLRTPRLPASTIQELNNCRTKEELWEFLRGLWSQREVREAIYLSSKTIFKELDSQLHKDYHPQKNKLLLSAYKYINRMSGRSTPFGLLAGVSVGSVSRKHTKILLSDEFLQTHRVDAIGFHNFLNPVIKDRSFAIFCTYFANNTLWEKYDRYYYLDYSDTDRKRSFNWAWVRKNPVLDMIFQRSKHGASIKELTQQLTQIGLDEHRSEQFIFELIDSNLLLSEFEFSTQDDFTSKGMKRLEDIRKKSTLPPSNNLIKPDNQVDLKVGTVENRIQEEVIFTITNELKELAVLCHSESPTDMAVFRKDFLKRYGDRQVPLLDAINPETGIGYGSKSASTNLPGSLLNDFQDGKIKATSTNLTDFIKLSMDNWQVSTDKGRQPELQINESDLQHYLKKRLPKEWPLGFYALGNLLLKASEEDQDQYFFNVLVSGGVSSIPLMTRFAHIDDQDRGWHSLNPPPLVTLPFRSWHTCHPVQQPWRMSVSGTVYLNIPAITRNVMDNFMREKINNLLFFLVISLGMDSRKSWPLVVQSILSQVKYWIPIRWTDAQNYMVSPVPIPIESIWIAG